LIAYLGVCGSDRSGGKFECAGRLPIDCGEPKRAQITVHGKHAMLPVEKQNVNTKAHPEGVDPVGRSNKEAMARRKRTATHKAHEPRQSRICDANPVSENRLAYRIGDAQQLPRSWTHGV